MNKNETSKEALQIHSNFSPEVVEPKSPPVEGAGAVDAGAAKVTQGKASKSF